MRGNVYSNPDVCTYKPIHLLLVSCMSNRRVDETNSTQQPAYILNN